MNPNVDALVFRFQAHPRAVTLAALAIASAPWVIDNYRKFLSLGKSRLSPLGPLGWLLATTMSAFGRETVSTAEYDRDANQERWLDTPLPERRGARPVTGWHCVPHRQLDRLPSDTIAEHLDAIFNKHAFANSTVVQIVPSPHEKLGPGMVIHPDIPSPHKQADRALREIAHVHATDHSLHLMLAPADCKTAIELGWAERHPLSGVSRILPLPSEYLLVYAPRDEEELGVVERIIVASIKYMTNSQSVA